MNLPAAQASAPAVVVNRETATQLSQSRLMPEHFYNDPASVQYVMEIGKALGVQPVSALAHVHVFPDSDGKLKCGLSADLMVALARAAGHTVHVFGNPVKATATLIRGDVTLEKIEIWKALGLDPKKYVVFEEVWTTQRAAEIGLMNKYNWKNYTQEMLKARAKSAVVRSGCSEVLIGITQILDPMGISLTDDMDDAIAISSARYTPDELGADTDEDGRPLRSRNPRQAPPQRATVPAAPAPAPEPPTPPQAAVQTSPQGPPSPQVPPSVQKFVDDSSASEIVSWAAKTTADNTVPARERQQRLMLVHSAAKNAGRDDTPVVHENKSTHLGAVLATFGRSLSPKK
jgi:hypothetical protein